MLLDNSSNTLFKTGKSLIFLLTFLIVGFLNHDVKILKKEIVILKEINNILSYEIGIIQTITSDIILDFNDSIVERRLLLLDFEAVK